MKAKAEISADIGLNGVIFEVGGYVEGVFMEVEIELILKLEIFRNVRNL